MLHKLTQHLAPAGTRTAARRLSLSAVGAVRSSFSSVSSRSSLASSSLSSSSLSSSSDLLHHRWQLGQGPKRWEGNRVVTVFGATGFLGRYVVTALARAGCTVVTPYRASQMDARHLKVCGDVGQVVLLPFNARDDASIATAVEQSEVVVNLIGRNWETKNYTFDDVHVDVAGRIAEAAAKAESVKGFVHVSAQGADKGSSSEFFKSKAFGEDAVKEAFPGATVVRPCPMFGHEDTFTNGYASLAFRTRKLALPAMHKLSAEWQPVYAPDVATALGRITLDHEAEAGEVFELGGPEVKEFADWVKQIYGFILEEPRYFQLPQSLAVAATSLTERVLHTPNFTSALSKGGDIDRVADTENTLGFEHLGLAPVPLGSVGIRWLRRWRHHTKQGVL